MASATKSYDAVVVDALTMVVGLIDQAARNIEGSAAAGLLQHRRADGSRTHGNVVEGEAHHRLPALEPHRRSTEMPGEAIGDARAQVRPGGHDHFRDEAGSRASSRRKPSQLRKMVLAAAPAAMSERRVRPGNSAASIGLRSARARCSKLSSCSTVAASK